MLHHHLHLHHHHHRLHHRHHRHHRLYVRLALILCSLTGISRTSHQKRLRFSTMRLRHMAIVVRLRSCWLVTLTNLVLPATTSVCPSVATVLFVHILNRAELAAALSRVKPSVNRVLALKPQTAFVNRRTVVLKLCTDLVPVTNTNITTNSEKGWSSDRPFFFCGLQLIQAPPVRSRKFPFQNISIPVRWTRDEPGM